LGYFVLKVREASQGNSPFGPFQISAMDPPTRLIATELAPPPKNRVVIMVAKFVPTPDGTRKMRNII